jgi:hypothetical protein
VLKFKAQQFNTSASTTSISMQAPIANKFNKSGFLPEILSQKSLSQFPKFDAKSDIITPICKNEMWDLKEKSSTSEVKMQYQIIKLEEKFETLS